MLWRDCDNATPWTEGDRDVINGTREVWEPGQDCPACISEAKEREYERRKAEWERREAAQLEWYKLKKIADDHNDMLKGDL